MHSKFFPHYFIKFSHLTQYIVGNYVKEYNILWLKAYGTLQPLSEQMSAFCLKNVIVLFKN